MSLDQFKGNKMHNKQQRKIASNSQSCDQDVPLADGPSTQGQTGAPSSKQQDTVRQFSSCPEPMKLSPTTQQPADGGSFKNQSKFRNLQQKAKMSHGQQESFKNASSLAVVPTSTQLEIKRPSDGLSRSWPQLLQGTAHDDLMLRASTHKKFLTRSYSRILNGIGSKNPLNMHPHCKSHDQKVTLENPTEKPNIQCPTDAGLKSQSAVRQSVKHRKEPLLEKSSLQSGKPSKASHLPIWQENIQESPAGHEPEAKGNARIQKTQKRNKKNNKTSFDAKIKCHASKGSAKFKKNDNLDSPDLFGCASSPSSGTLSPQHEELEMDAGTAELNNQQSRGSADSNEFQENKSDDLSSTLKLEAISPTQAKGLTQDRAIEPTMYHPLHSSIPSGSKDLDESAQGGQPPAAPADKHERGKNRKQRMVFSLDFLDDEDGQVPGAQCPGMEKTADRELSANQYSNSHVQGTGPVCSDLSQSQSSSLDESLGYSPPENQEEYDEDAVADRHRQNIPDDLEFLTSDQVKNFENLQTFNMIQQNKDDGNESGKLNVSLQSSEENKILEKNGGNLQQLKSSPMMRPRAYRASGPSPRRSNSTGDGDAQEEETHDKIILRLIDKLNNESVSPTKLKVQQNLQNNVDFYNENEQYVQQQPQFIGQQAPGQAPCQPFYQNQQGSCFQLNPCVNQQMNPVHLHQEARNFVPYGYHGHQQVVGQGPGFPNNIQPNFGFNGGQVGFQHQLPPNVYYPVPQYNLGFGMVQNAVGAQPTIAQPAQPMMDHNSLIHELESQLRQLPINLQFRLLTDEAYMQQQFQLEQLLKQQMLQEQQRRQEQLQQQMQTQLQQQFNPLWQGNIIQPEPRYGSGGMGSLANHNLQPQQVDYLQNPNQLMHSCLPQNYHMINMQQQMPLQMVAQGQEHSWPGGGRLLAPNEQRAREQLTPLLLAKKNKYQLYFEQQIAKIGFDTSAQLEGGAMKKSAFSINECYRKLFMLEDGAKMATHEILDVKSKPNQSIEHSSNKVVSAPDDGKHAQSIFAFSESSFHSPQPPEKKAVEAPVAPNRLLQMATNVQNVFDQVNRYKRAREKYLDEIRLNKPKVDYIKSKGDVQVAAEGYGQQQHLDVLEQPNDKQEQYDPRDEQCPSKGNDDADDNREDDAVNNEQINDLSGLGKFENLVPQDDGLVEQRLRRERANSKRYQRDQYEEIGLGSGGEYVLRQNQIIVSPENVKYKIVQYLGQGTFGQVVKCINLQTGSEHAVKIIKNKTEYILQGIVETKILEKLNNSPDRTEFEKQHLIKMQDYFVFRDYLCIVFELLSKSLYDVIQETERGLSLDIVRDYTRQILEALVTCKQANMIHCDLKPENILVANDGVNVKLIDFGSAAFNGHQVYTYIQSRYYRAPEVLMGCQKFKPANIFKGETQPQPVPLYDQSIDMWSLACTAIELFIKIPIFPGKYDYDQLLKILEFCGQPTLEMIQNSQNRDRFFFFNPQQQNYMFKTFYQFVITMVPPELQGRVEQPMNYHQYYNFPQLLESHYMAKLKKEKHDLHQAQQTAAAAQGQRHFIPFDFEYGGTERLKIYQFIDFVQQILQVDPRKRLTPLQALSHPFITGEDMIKLPFVPASDYQLQNFRSALLRQQNMDHHRSQSKFEFPNGPQHQLLPISRGQRSASEPLPGILPGKFSASYFFNQVQQANGHESFRPPIYALPENIFYGNCCETTISEFYQESKIRFQIHQDENILDEIEMQRSLLLSHRFCDAAMENYGIVADEVHNAGASEAARVDSEDHEKKSCISMLEINRQKSMQQIKEDKSILQPKKKKLTENESEKFIREFLHKELMANVSIEAERLQKKKMEEEKKDGNVGSGRADEHKNSLSLKIQLSYFEDFFIGPQEEKFKFDERSFKSREGRPSSQHRSRLERNINNFYGINNMLNIQNGVQSLCLSNLREDIRIFKEKERSGSSDTIQKQQCPQPEIKSLFSKKPSIQEALLAPHAKLSSPISSISGEARSEVNLRMSSKEQASSSGYDASETKGVQSQSMVTPGKKNDLSKKCKPILKFSQLADYGQDESQQQFGKQKKRRGGGRGQREKKKLRRCHHQTPFKNGQSDSDGHSADIECSHQQFGQFGSSNMQTKNLGSQSQCAPFSEQVKGGKNEVVEDGCGVNSGSDYDTEQDTDYGKQLKHESDQHEGAANCKGSNSLRNNNFSNNNSFEHQDMLDHLSGSIKETYDHDDEEKVQGEGGIACLREMRVRPKRAVKKNKKKK